MTAAGNLAWKVSRRGDETRVEFDGPLTETSDFTGLLAEPLGRGLVVDLAGVGRVNSYGVRAWLGFVSELDRRGLSLALERCPPAIVGQLNLVENFAGASGKVRSVFAPYYCSGCDSDQLDLIDLATTFEVPLTRPCPNCASPMEFDDLSEIYLGFASS